MNQKMEINSATSADMYSIQGAVSVIQHVVPNVNKLLEDNILLLSESFTRIAQSSKDLQNKLSKLEHPQKAEFLSLANEIGSGVSSAIIGMQFQDRVSQNLVIVNEIANNLNNFIKSNYSKFDNNINVEFSKLVLSLIKLGEIRDHYIENLKSQNLIEDGSEIGFNADQDTSHVNADEVELF